MLDRLIAYFSQTGFMPHIHCYLAKPGLVWTMFVTDILIGIAYVAISLMLYALIRRVQIPFSRMALCFGVFIGACGGTHFMEVWTLWHPDYWVAAWVKSLTALASVGTGIYLFRLRHLIAQTVEAARQAETHRLRFVASARDLAARENTLRSFFDSAPMMMGIADVEGDDIRHVSDNPAAAAFFGSSRETLQGKLASELGVAESVIRLWVGHYRRAEASVRPERYEYLHESPSGSRWLSVAVSFIGKDPQGKSRFSYIAQDITDIRRTEAELRESKRGLEQRIEERTADLRASERQFRTLADSIPQLVWMAEADGYIFWYNRRWYDYTGTRPEDMVGGGWQSVHNPHELPRVLAQWTHSTHLGDPFEMEFPLRAADGRYHWFLTRVHPMKDASGRVVRWFGTNTNIDDQRQMRKSLEEAVRARDEFLSIASHELKTPLTSLKLQAQLRQRAISKSGKSGLPIEKLKPTLDTDARQIERLSRLIDDMLDISRINTGKLPINRERVDLCALVKEVVERYRPQLEAAGCPTSVDACAQVSGDWDRFRIEQVLANLLTNAMKYGAGKPVALSVSAEGDGRAKVSISDQGMGIARENQERIFQRFERAISANEISGLGLGLYIVKQIVEMHGGAVGVESELGKGSVFTVELPLAGRPPGDAISMRAS